jgi:hypothetical protein
MRPLTPGERARNAAQDIRPSDIYAYIDCVHAWVPRPFALQERAWLKRHCRWVRALPRRKRWDRHRYRQYLDLKQPTDVALHYLANINNVLVNYVEFALDWTFRYEDERDAATDIVNAHMIKRWHRESQGIRFVKATTRYTAGRHASTNLVSYADLPSRMTGELACVHIEYRVRGQRTLRRMGISSPKNLVNYDHHAFWKQRLCMRAIDPDKMGRLHNRRVMGKGPRVGAWTSPIYPGLEYNYDRMAAGIIKRSLGSTQAIIDCYRKYGDVNACLVDLDVGHLLPELWVNMVAVGKNNIAMCQLVRGAKTHLAPLILDRAPSPRTKLTLDRPTARHASSTTGHD